MLPEPALTFTIPSIHDDVTTLECRVYHPQSLTPSPRAPPWRRHAAVVAHPYAPLGGSYDDPVVETIVGVLLRQGIAVGTFNFRGAGGSTGRTSWTSKAERGDYVSFAAFMCYYVHYLDPFRPRSPAELKSPLSPLSPPMSPTPLEGPLPAVEEATAAGDEQQPALLLCGYSYGAMITKLAPPLSAVLAPFESAKTASAAADIRLRAQHLAERQNVILASARAAALAEEQAPLASPRSRASASALSGLRVGGDEDRRRSQEHGGRRSFSLDAEDKIRKGVAELMQRAKSHQAQHHHHHRLHRLRNKKSLGQKELGDVEVAKAEEAPPETAEAEEKEPDTLQPVTDMLRPRVAYLLVSPPIGWATSLMTMNLAASPTGWFGRRPKATRTEDKTSDVSKGAGREDTAVKQSSSIATADSRQERQKLVDNPTLAVYGDADVFVGVRRYRDWASKLQAAPESRFRAHEISTAGHFYAEPGTMQKLADAVRTFAAELLVGPRTSAS